MRRSGRRCHPAAARCSSKVTGEFGEVDQKARYAASATLTWYGIVKSCQLHCTEKESAASIYILLYSKAGIHRYLKRFTQMLTMPRCFGNGDQDFRKFPIADSASVSTSHPATPDPSCSHPARAGSAVRLKCM